MTMDPKICEGFTKEEVAWLHWQEYEWLDRQKAQNAQALKRIVKDQVVTEQFIETRSRHSSLHQTCTGVVLSDLRVVFAQIVIVDFGDGTHVKGPLLIC